jgi:hypothetical protein
MERLLDNEQLLQPPGHPIVTPGHEVEGGTRILEAQRTNHS